MSDMEEEEELQKVAHLTVDPTTITLEEAREWLREVAYIGGSCPCCTQLVKIYRRKLYNTMAAQLIRAHKKYEFGEFHVSKVVRGSNNFALLRYWELIESLDPEKLKSGMWKVTAKGGAFVRRETKVPSHVFTYDEKFLGIGGWPIDIEEALGRKFNYDELMNSPGEGDIL